MRVLMSGFKVVPRVDGIAGPGSTLLLRREFASTSCFRQKFFRLFGVWQLSFSDRLLGFFSRCRSARTLRESA